MLNLKNVFDVESLRDYAGRYDINDTIQQLRRKISLSPGVVILKDSARSKLNDLAQSGLSDIKFYQYAELLAENITNINLEHLAKQLREVSAKLPEGQDEIRLSLEKNAHDLEHYHRDLVMPMATLSEQLSANALMLQENIKFNHSSMADAIHDLVDEVTKAQQFLNKDGPEYVQYVCIPFFHSYFCKIIYIHLWLNVVINIINIIDSSRLDLAMRFYIKWITSSNTWLHLRFSRLEDALPFRMLTMQRS